MPETNFIEARFPTSVSLGSTGGPMWQTEIVEKVSGHEERNTPWAMPRYRYDAKYGIRRPADIYEVLKIYQVARGRLRGFRFKDHGDFKSRGPTEVATALDQSLGAGDGTTITFPLFKRYAFASQSFDRRISKPVAGKILVAAGGVATTAFTLDAVAGTVTFASAPGNSVALTWGGEFDVPVRFDSDNLDITLWARQ
jgi:uncharacterized protein (TIGR02217 family)